MGIMVSAGLGIVDTGKNTTGDKRIGDGLFEIICCNAGGCTAYAQTEPGRDDYFPAPAPILLESRLRLPSLSSKTSMHRPR